MINATGFGDQVKAAWKWVISFRTSDWELRDYPISTREHEPDPTYTGTRLKQHRFTAYIVNWGLIGVGDSRSEALTQLAEHFETAKTKRLDAAESLPRPGTHVTVEFASQERVGANAELAQDFIQRVLELEWAWISDESSLWDFHRNDTNDVLIAKIKDIYEVDVSDVKSARLCEILERISALRGGTSS